MAYTLELIMRSDFKDTYEFSQEVSGKLPFLGHFGKDCLVAIDTELDFGQGAIPEFLRPATDFLNKGSMGYSLRILLVKGGKQLQNELHPLRQAIKEKYRIENMPLPFLYFSDGFDIRVFDCQQLAGVGSELADVIKQKYHDYFLISQDPVEVLNAEDLGKLNAADLPSLTVSSVREIIQQLPTYYRLFIQSYQRFRDNDTLVYQSLQKRNLYFWKLRVEEFESEEGVSLKKEVKLEDVFELHECEDNTLVETTATAKAKRRFQLVEFGGHYDDKTEHKYFLGENGWFLHTLGRRKDELSMAKAEDIANLIEWTRQGTYREHDVAYFDAYLGIDPTASRADQKCILSLDNLAKRVRRALGLIE